MLINIADVADGALVGAIGVAARRIGAALTQPRGRRGEDLDIVRWFQTYRLTDAVPDLPDLSPALTDRLAAILNGDEIQAALQELLAARLTDAPEVDAESARNVIRLTLGVAGQDVAGFASSLANYYDDQISALVGRLGVYEPQALAQIRFEAFATRMVAILGAIERHTAALTTRPSQRTEASFLSGYRRHVTDQHGKLEPPDFERRRRVPIRDIYVPTGITEDSYPERAVVSLPDDRPSFDVYELAARLDRSVLLGDPGGGKTTAANVLMDHFAAHLPDRVPFLVTLRDYAAKDPPERSVAGHIQHTLETFYQCPALPGLVDLLLLTGRAVVIFDGLDELLDTARRADVTARVERFCTEYPLAPVLVTSRAVGYDQARLDERQFRCYRLGGFGDDAVEEYARKWFALEADALPGDAAAFVSESVVVPDLRSNPLMLALLCILYRGEGSLPRNRAEVYEQCAIILYRRWDARRRIHQDLRAGHLVEPALRHLAWRLFTRDEPQPAVSERELIAATTEFLHGRGFESPDDAREAAEEFVTFCRGRMWVFSDAGTSASGERLYAFTHRTFLEYFAATQIAYDSDTPEQLADTLAPRVASEQWSVVAELAVQIKDRTSNNGAARIYAVLLRGRDWSATEQARVLGFLSLCLRSVDPSPQLVRDLTRRLVEAILAAVNTGREVRSVSDVESRVIGDASSWDDAANRLIDNCGSYGEVVADEVAAFVADTIQSGDRLASADSLRLTAWLYFRSPAYTLWAARMDDIFRAYATAVTETSAEDFYVRNRALRQGLISVRQALEMPGALSALFLEPKSIFPRYGLIPYLEAIYLLMLRGWPAFADSASVTVLESIGEYLRDHPQLPWVRGHISWFGDIANDDIPFVSDPGSAPLSAIACLGSAAILSILAECGRTDILYRDPWQFSPLDSLFPYIDHRLGHGTDAELPELPVPEEFRQVFRDWAEGRVDFTAPGPTADGWDAF